MSATSERDAKLRRLPKIHTLIEHPEIAALIRHHGRALVVSALRSELAARRQTILDGGDISETITTDTITQRLVTARAPSLRRVINATGVVLHTNLGRAPLARAVAEHVAAMAQGYSNLELDLATGERGSRHEHATAALRELVGSEAALVVNNGAAGVLLALAALSSGKQVIVSRGELIEIGGSFRVPDIMRSSGCALVEVGTTNRTHAADYANAITPDTAMLLKVHRSNFALVGFQAEVSVEELAAIAKRHQLPLVVDLGSGAILDGKTLGLDPPEPTIAEVLAAGADLVLASGDKLLGGPQAGLLVGRQALVDRCAKHPLMRALRPSKLTFAALAATLDLYRTERWREIPALAALAATEDELHVRATRLCNELATTAVKELTDPAARVRSEKVRLRSAVGGGSMPLCEPWSWGVALVSDAWSAAALLQRLRAASPHPVIGRIVDDRVVLDLRSVALDEEPSVLQAIRAIS